MQCSVCDEPLPAGDVPFDDPSATSDAEAHLKACGGRAVRVFADIDEVVGAFRKVVDAFMGGRNPTTYGVGRDAANVWVARHYATDQQTVAFETLVIEPNGSRGPGQYEVAVRFPGAANELSHYAGEGRHAPGYVCSTGGLCGYGVDH